MYSLLGFALLEINSYLSKKKKKKKRPYTQRGFKDQKWSKNAHLSKSRFWERREEKRERELGLGRRSRFGVIPSHFFFFLDN